MSKKLTRPPKWPTKAPRDVLRYPMIVLCAYITLQVRICAHFAYLYFTISTYNLPTLAPSVGPRARRMAHA